MNPREFFGLKKDDSMNPKNFLRIRTLLEQNKPRQRRYIGVGYRDKGNIVNLSYDGTPTWQELAGSCLDLSLELHQTEMEWKSKPDWLYRDDLQKTYRELKESELKRALELQSVASSPDPPEKEISKNNGESDTGSETYLI